MTPEQPFAPGEQHPGGRLSPLIMGVVNTTPDSFSDGGQFFEADDAIAHGLELFDQGADIVDVGGESTRPGAAAVDPDEQIRRTVPVITALCGRGRVSIDTTSAQVARAAVDAGASLINDVSAGLAEAAADLGVGWVAMHMLGTPATMQSAPRYDDVVAEVASALAQAAAQASDLGVREIWIDPGIGFGKTPEHNMELLGGLEVLVELGYPVLLGTSRKSSLGRWTAAYDLEAAGGDATSGDSRPAVIEDRLDLGLASALWAASRGVRMVRVHDVAETVAAVAGLNALRDASPLAAAVGA